MTPGKRIWIGTALLVLTLVGTASALRVRGGDLILIANGDFAPRSLPEDHDAPITIYGSGRFKTVSGELPAILQKIVIEFDRHGSVQTKGLPVCTEGKLALTTVPVARSNCPGAIVGKGFGRAVVQFTGQRRIPVSSPLTIFNGPRRHGNPTVFAHAYTDVPTATTFVVPIEIERINKGVYGYRTEAKIPKIAGGYGHPISGWLRIGRRWTHRGKRHSFVNARCETGRLQARGTFSFKNDTVLFGTFFRPCSIRR
jgi:hypothetical protein